MSRELKKHEKIYLHIEKELLYQLFRVVTGIGKVIILIYIQAVLLMTAEYLPVNTSLKWGLMVNFCILLYISIKTIFKDIIGIEE